MSTVSNRARLALKRQLAARVQTTILASAAGEAYREIAEQAVARIPEKGKAKASQKALAKFRAELRTLAPKLQENAVQTLQSDFRARGIPLPPEDQLARYAAIEAKRVIKDAGDLLTTLTRAEKGTPGSFSVDALTSSDHAELVTRSLTQVIRDGVEQKATARSNELTGRRRLRTGAGSRRSAINGQIAEPGKSFTDFDGKSFNFPRENPSDVDRWSNSTIKVEYETTDGRFI